MNKEQTKPSPAARKFRMNGKTLLGGICGTIMGPGFFVSLLLFPGEFEEFGTIGLIVFVLMFGGFAIFGPMLIYQYLCYVAPDDRGLYGYRPFQCITFIPWTEVSRVTADEPNKRLVVEDESGRRKILIEYQFVDFDEVTELIRQAVKPEAFAVDQVEHTFRIGRVFILLCWVGCFGSLGVAYVMYPQRMDGALAGIFCAGALAHQLVTVVLRVDLNPEGIVLRQLLLKRFIPYPRISRIDSTVALQQGDRTVLVQVVLTNRKTITLKHLSGSSEVLKRSLEIAIEAHRRLHPDSLS